MVSVNVNNYGSLDKALKAFKTRVRKAHIIELSNQKTHFISRSELKRRRKKRKIRTNQYEL
ncbi:MAG: 30S ribosomal protein S21 [Calditrichaceae bacterium]|nr:30S ribosomal protein S21 [Calditrichaceae bacterium]MBN2708857.1 30S ribosomal protein S21 [Calditrichaceae bacterium]RQV97616.1 MAG: 30S ribosomal protein S21 [Calditrichota bacterium]